MDLATATRRIERLPDVEPDDCMAAQFQIEPDSSGHNPFRSESADMLRRVGLRPTRQRLLLSELLFSDGGDHVTAEKIHARATATKIQISLATVYNTLNQFTDAGLLRRIGINGCKSFFDTNMTAHHHFFVDQEDRMLDLPEPGVEFQQLPPPLPGYEIVKVDVVIHLRRKQR